MNILHLSLTLQGWILGLLSSFVLLTCPGPAKEVHVCTYMYISTITYQLICLLTTFSNFLSCVLCMFPKAAKNVMLEDWTLVCTCMCCHANSNTNVHTKQCAGLTTVTRLTVSKDHQIGDWVCRLLISSENIRAFL